MQMSIHIPLSGNVSRNQLQEMFGSLHRSKSFAPEGKICMKKTNLKSNSFIYRSNAFREKLRVVDSLM